MKRPQNTSASLLREVIIGDSHGARMNIVSYVNQVSSSLVSRYILINVKKAVVYIHLNGDMQ